MISLKSAGGLSVKKYSDARDAIFEELYEIAKNDRNVILLTADTGAMAFRSFQENIPDQFYNVGIAEQNMISVAAGLAKEGKKVFVYGISNFVTLRCLEQIRVDICAMNLPITIIGSGTGYTYSSDGVTHHMTDDLSMMRALPNLTILSPSDLISCVYFLHYAYKNDGPVYLRFDRGVAEEIYTDDGEIPVLCNLRMWEGAYSAIISTGVMVKEALKISDFLHKEGSNVDVIDVSQLKPFDAETFFEMALTYERIFSLEEHTLVGGLGSLLAEALIDSHQRRIPVLYRFGIPDVFSSEVGSREYLRKSVGIGTDQIIDKIRTILTTNR
jgi:transketolase